MTKDDGKVYCDICVEPSRAAFRLGPSTTEFEVGVNVDVCVHDLAVAVVQYPRDPCAVKVLVEA